MHGRTSARDASAWRDLSFLLTMLTGTTVALPVRAQPVVGGEVRIAIDSNPLLLPGGRNEAVIAEVTVRPRYKTQDATGNSLDVATVVTARRYSRRYNNFLLGSARVTGTLRESERLSITAFTSYVRDVVGDSLATSIDGVLEPQAVRNLVEGSASLTWRPDARTSVVPLLSYERATYERTRLLRSTDSAHGEVAVTHQFSARTTAGIRPMFETSKIRGYQRLLRTAVFGTLRQVVSPRWTLSGELGAEHIDGRLGLPGVTLDSPSRTSLSGMVELCAAGEVTNACFTASLGSEVSAVYGFQRRKTVGASFTQRLDSTRTLRAEAEYQRVASPGLVGGRDLDAASALLALEWQLRPTLILAVETQYRRRELGGRDTPQSGYAGIRIQLNPRVQ